jgi:hypothetical protein
MLDEVPNWRAGHYVRFEDIEFMVTDIRYNDEYNRFEYRHGPRWYNQKHLVFVR